MPYKILAIRPVFVSLCDMIRAFSLISVFLFTACQSQTQTSPQKLDDLWHAINRPHVQLCALDLTKLEGGDTAGVLERFGPDFASPSAIGYGTLRDGPTAVQSYSRRHAVRRRLLAGPGGHEHAQNYYDRLPYNGPPAKTLSDHTARMAHWWDKVREQQGRSDTDTPNYNIRFCVINEMRGHDAVAARTFLIDAINSGEGLSLEDVNAYFDQDRILPEAFKTDVIAAMTEQGHLSSLDLALMRDNQSSVAKFDPTTAEAFWQARDLEIEAILVRIDTHDYTALADRLDDITRIDQTLRGLWQWSRHNDVGTHFTSPEERKAFEDGISARIGRVDNFNTETLKTILNGRGWFNDDLDGRGAADDGWLIAQHADDDPEFQAYALGLIEQALDNPGVSKRNYAYLFDRIMVKKTGGESYDPDTTRQRYGTQGRCTNDGWKPHNLEDSDNIDTIRANVDLRPLKDYIAVLTAAKPMIRIKPRRRGGPSPSGQMTPKQTK